jgi:hypothetical protein
MPFVIAMFINVHRAVEYLLPFVRSCYLFFFPVVFACGCPLIIPLFSLPSTVINMSSTQSSIASATTTSSSQVIWPVGMAASAYSTGSAWLSPMVMEKPHAGLEVWLQHQALGYTDVLSSATPTTTSTVSIESIIPAQIIPSTKSTITAISPLVSYLNNDSSLDSVTKSCYKAGSSIWLGLARDLERIATQTNDFFVPGYQQILDPNAYMARVPIEDKDWNEFNESYVDDIDGESSVDWNVAHESREHALESSMQATYARKSMPSYPYRWIATEFLRPTDVNLTSYIRPPAAVNGEGASIAPNEDAPDAPIFTPSPSLSSPTIGGACVNSLIHDYDPLVYGGLYGGVDAIWRAAWPALSLMRRARVILADLRIIMSSFKINNSDIVSMSKYVMH